MFGTQTEEAQIVEFFVETLDFNPTDDELGFESESELEFYAELEGTIDPFDQ